MTSIDRTRLADLLATERATHEARNPRSKELFDAGTHLVGQVPMTWMNKWSGGFPLYLDQAASSRVRVVDGHELIDFALGDTGAMAGHSPTATVEAIERRVGALGRPPGRAPQWRCAARIAARVLRARKRLPRRAR